MNIVIKRVYEPWSEQDGLRILVDRLWPRGISKEAAHIDLWLKDISPSGELRKEFHNNPEKWHEFKGRYREELLKVPQVLSDFKQHAHERERVTLLYAAKDTAHNNAQALLELLEQGLG